MANQRNKTKPQPKHAADETSVEETKVEENTAQVDTAEETAVAEQVETQETGDGDQESLAAKAEKTGGDETPTEGQADNVGEKVAVDETATDGEQPESDAKSEEQAQPTAGETQPLVVKAPPSMKRVEPKQDTININTITTEEYFQMKHGYVIGSGSSDLIEIIEFLDRYENEMARGLVVSEQKGASLQHQLYRTYLRALLIAPKERDIAMDYILWKFFKNEKSSYRVTNLGRFTRSARWDIPELLMFNTMNSIFHAVANPAERLAQIREYKLGAIAAKFPTEKARYTEAFLEWAQRLR